MRMRIVIYLSIVSCMGCMQRIIARIGSGIRTDGVRDTIRFGRIPCAPRKPGQKNESYEMGFHETSEKNVLQM
jgi:hypothetical protein